MGYLFLASAFLYIFVYLWRLDLVPRFLSAGTKEIWTFSKNV